MADPFPGASDQRWAHHSPDPKVAQGGRPGRRGSDRQCHGDRPRVEIPKGPGKSGTRPLGIPTVADRLLQRAVARIIEAVFEADFLDCSYGFRPGRNPHHALQALRLQIVSKKVNHVFEADIRSYFTRISHQWLRKMVAHRIADPAILKLIGTCLRPGRWSMGHSSRPRRVRHKAAQYRLC